MEKSMFFSQPQNYEEYILRKNKLEQEYSLISDNYNARLAEHAGFAEVAFFPVILTFFVGAAVTYIPQLIILLADSIITGFRLAMNRLEDWDISPPEEYLPFSGL